MPFGGLNSHLGFSQNFGPKDSILPPFGALFIKLLCGGRLRAVNMDLKLIQSFQINHDKLKRGMYISRVDGDIITYDLRMKVPNSGDYLDNAALHTIEHLFATFVRSTDLSDKIVYFGPMGCRTGFYFITRGMENAQAIELVKKAFDFTEKFEGKIPGAERRECGNYLNHDLAGSKKEAREYLAVLENVSVDTLKYEN
jgi:S-ribosylhomocysteine lyase